MTSKIEYLGNLRTTATHLLSGNQIITDAPPDNQGKGEASAEPMKASAHSAKAARTPRRTVTVDQEPDIGEFASSMEHEVE